MFRLLIAVYRANPLRPHCDGAAGRHVWLCRALVKPGDCEGVLVNPESRNNRRHNASARA